MIHPPQTLQGYLWSCPVSALDIDKDRVYIINQILAYGGLGEMRWLFQTYPKGEIVDVFLNHPIRTYRRPTFHLVRDIILQVRTRLPETRYVADPPYRS